MRLVQIDSDEVMRMVKYGYTTVYGFKASELGCKCGIHVINDFSESRLREIVADEARVFFVIYA